WTHLTSSTLLVGCCTTLLLAGRSDRVTAVAWEARVARWARVAVLVALAAGVGMLALQTAVLEDRAAAVLEGASLLRVLLETQGGVVWLVRHGVLLLLAVFLWMKLDLTRRIDWQLARAEAAFLALAALGAFAAAGHAVGVEPDTASAVVTDLVHLIATGIWAGGLVPLAALLRSACTEAGADARPYAVLAARRFSLLAATMVVVLAVTGVLNSTVEVGSVAGLVGTRHGRLLLAKLGLLVPVLVLGFANRRWLLPALSGDGATLGRPAMRRLAASVLAEGSLLLLVLGLVAVMGMTPPGAHGQPAWPFAFRLSADSLQHTPEIQPRVLVGSQVAVLGAVGVLAALVLRRALRLPLLAGAGVLFAAGLAIALPPLAIDAYPTTYQRPAVPYQAASIAAGATTFQAHCATCHGPAGGGDGPAGRAMWPRPADLRAPHVVAHTAGDLYWWITHGLRQMPAFGERLSPDTRWDLVNFIRALGAAAAARSLDTIEPGRPRIVAPDFTFAVGGIPARSLKDFRGRRIVLLVLYTLPASRPRLDSLARRQLELVTQGLEVIAVPMDAAPDAIRRLGPSQIFYAVVTEGARDIVDTYRLFAPRAQHAEFLVDRQGYLRAITREMPADLDALTAQLRALNAEKVTAAEPLEHVH
ncbi:MAG: CopD family protein, partial [Candidatus Rokuibacteriota bacterium]